MADVAECIDKPVITLEMIEAGEEAILASALRPEIAVSSWASSLAEQVYLAMEDARCPKRNRSQ